MDTVTKETVSNGTKLRVFSEQATPQRAAFPASLDALDLEERSYTALFPYNTPDVLRRIFVPGVFADFLANPSWQVQHLWVHNDFALPLGPVLEITETDAGLLFKAQFSDTVLGRDAWQLVVDKALAAVSISWLPQVVEREERNGVTFLLQQKAKLFDVSPVNFGGMPGAKILRDVVAHFGLDDAVTHEADVDCCSEDDCISVPKLPYDLHNLPPATGDGAHSDHNGACPCSDATRLARQQLRLLGLRIREGG
jgi:HK97 family phage prohead protease